MGNDVRFFLYNWPFYISIPRLISPSTRGWVVEGINLTLRPGQLMAVLGGAGVLAVSFVNGYGMDFVNP